MLKKLVVLGIVGFVAVSAVKGSRVGDRVRSYIDELCAKAEPKYSPQQEVERIRREVKLLDKDIMTVVNQLAKERVDVRHLQQKVEELRASQGRDKELLAALAAKTKNAAEQVAFGDRTLSVPEAKAELEEGVRRYNENQKSLEGMESALVSREKVRGGLEKQLETLRNQKVELSAALDALEAKLTALKLKQMESRYQTDETRLAKIKEDMRALETKLEVEEEKLKILPAALDAKPAKASKPAQTKTVDEIMSGLGGKPEQRVPAAD